MTPLDDETQRLLAIYDAWLACRCGEQERWAEDGAGRCKHERALHYEAETACELIRSLSERLARVEGEERERCARICESVNNYDNPMTANDCAAAIRAGK